IFSIARKRFSVFRERSPQSESDIVNESAVVDAVAKEAALPVVDDRTDAPGVRLQVKQGFRIEDRLVSIWFAVDASLDHTFRMFPVDAMVTGLKIPASGEVRKPVFAVEMGERVATKVKVGTVG